MRINHKAEDQTQRKFVFMMNWRVGGTWEVLVKSSFLADFDGHVGKWAEGFEGNGIGKRNAEVRRLLELRDKRELCVANTWLIRKRKITYNAGECETEIDFVVVGRLFSNRDVKVISWDLQHRLVVVDLYKKVLKRL